MTFLDKPYPGQFNRYAYTWNDPINANDPDGEFLNFVAGAAIGLAFEAYSIHKEGGDIFDVKGNAGRYGKAGAVGALTGGVGGAVAKKGIQEGGKAIAKKGLKTVKSRTKDGSRRISKYDKDGNKLKDITEKRVKEWKMKDTPVGPKPQRVDFKKGSQPGSKYKRDPKPRERRELKKDP